MKIKHIKDSSTVWSFFYDYSVKSKPYDGCEFASRRLRTAKIKDFFEDLVSSCDIYMAEEEGESFGVAFISEEKNFMHLRFAFGISSSGKFTHPKWTAWVYNLFDLLLKRHNKNYFIVDYKIKCK